MEGEDQMKGLLNRDITIRSLSVLFAVILWFIVLDNTNPPEPKSFTIPLKLINEDSLKEKGIGIKNKNYQTNISVTVKARKEKMGNIGPEDFQAVLDFSKVDGPGTKQLQIDGPYYIGKDSGVTIEEIKPRAVNIEFEKIVEGSFRITVETTGNEAGGFKVVKKTSTPELISLSGFESVIKSVASVKSTVDISNIDKGVVIKKECKVYNKNGEEIVELSRNLSAEIKLEVAKEVPVTPVIRGNPARNFAEGVKSVRPDKVLITGTPEVLSKIDDIKTEVVDIENSSKNIDVIRTLKLPDGVRLYNMPQEAAVSVAIDQLAKKDFTIAAGDVNIINTKADNSLKYEIMTASMLISIRGNQSELDKLDLGKLKPFIDVSGLDEGTYKVPLKFTLYSSVKSSEEYSVDLKISRKESDNRGKSISKD